MDIIKIDKLAEGDVAKIGRVVSTTDTDLQVCISTNGWGMSQRFCESTSRSSELILPATETQGRKWVAKARRGGFTAELYRIETVTSWTRIM